MKNIRQIFLILKLCFIITIQQIYSCSLIVEGDEYIKFSGDFRKLVCSNLADIEEFFELKKGSTKGVVKVVKDSDYFLRYRAPSWSNAFFVSGVILIPYSTYQSKNLLRAVRHELTHLVIYKNFGPTVPEWLDEGLALYLESTDDNEYLIKFFELWRNNPKRPSLTRLTSGMSALPQREAMQAYGVSYYAVRFLINQGYKNPILSYLRNSKLKFTPQDIERALLSVDKLK